jgi:hypothetical protein
MGRKRRFFGSATAVLLLLSATGCGAAFYGTALAIFLTQQKKTTQTKTSFPDAVPTADVVPAFATIELSSSTVTITRTVSNQAQIAQVNTNNVATTSSSSTANSTNITLTDFQILNVDFPPGYGQARSNRDTATSLLAGDRMVVRINQDDAVALTFTSGDVASTGTEVAAAIQTKVRALHPTVASVSAEAYSLFTASFDPVTGSYVFVSGAPGETSEVVFEPAPRVHTGFADAAPDPASTATAARLGLGTAQGGIETGGAESVSLTILNRGDDTIPLGTPIDLYLSHVKVLDSTAILFDTITTNATIAVGEARRFTRKNGTPPPKTLLRQDITPGAYFVIFDVHPSNGEQVVKNNQLTSTHPIEVYQPEVDPARPASAAATTFAGVDFVPTSTAGPIGIVPGKLLSSNVAITNYNSTVSTPVPIDIDVVLSGNQQFAEPAGFFDPAGGLAGVHVNPTNPNRPIQFVVSGISGSGPIHTSVANDTVTVTFDPTTSGANVATVQSLVDALDSSQSLLVDAFVDGNGSPSTDSLVSLLNAAGTAIGTATSVFVTTFHASFAPVTLRNQTQTFLVSDTLRATSFSTTVLPIKVFPFYRIRPHLPIGSGFENTANNIRQGVNYMRVVDPSRAFFDTATGALLPTVNSNDFAELAAVTQRPVNTGSIQQGQQRVFSFTLPDEGLTFDQSQLLVILRAPTFDARLDLLSSSGDFLAASDDTALGTSPLIYTPVQADQTTRTLYLVVAPARADESDLSGGGATFDLTISVNPRLITDLGPVSPINADNVLRNVKQRFEPPATAPRIENNVLVPFTLVTGKSEIMLILPQPARVKFRSAPVFSTGVDTTITAFISGQVPTPVEFQAELDENFNRIVYRPKGGDVNSSLLLEDGVYTVAFNTTGDVSAKDLVRLEIDTQFVPDTILKPSGAVNNTSGQ